VFAPNSFLQTWYNCKALALRLKSLVLTLMYYGSPDTIVWSYILSDNGRVIHILTNKQGCCPWSLVDLNCGTWSWPWPWARSNPC